MGPVDRRCTRAALVLMDLETAQIICGRRIGRAAQKGSQTPNMTDIVMLGMWAETLHYHVVLHPLA